MSRTSKRTAWWHRFTGGGRSAGPRLLGVNTKLRCERLESRYLLTANLMDAPIVVLQTNNGDVAMEMLSTEAPGTVDNFLTYVQHEDYNNAIFHRLDPGFVLQGGGYNVDQELLEGSTPGLVHTHDPILNEPGVSNVRGTVAMAKGDDPDSATNQFFFNLEDNSEHLDNLNGGFTVFATVADMTAVDLMESHEVYDFDTNPEHPNPFGELPLSGTAPNLTFLMIQSTSGDGEIRGTVFADLNRDGVQDVGELGIAGATVFVDANDDGQLDGGELSLTTDSQGEYTFTVPGGTDVNPLNYVVRHVLPAETEATIGDGRATADVKIGRYTENVNFGEVDLPSVEVTASDPIATEAGLESGSFTITVTGAADPVEVFYTLSGTATEGSDYVSLATGSLTVDGSGTVLVMPIDDNQYNEGAESVVLTLSAAAESYLLGSATAATVEITDNDVAALVADTITLYETAVDTTLDVLSNDTLPVASTIGSITTPDQAGTAFMSFGGQSITYNPAGGYRGEENFSYAVTLPDGSVLTASVTVTIDADLPSAIADLFAVDGDSTGNTFTVLANDFLDSGTEGLLSIFSVGIPSQGGTVTIAEDDLSLEYTPAANFSGEETFFYTIEGPVGDQATAQVTVTVASTADSPNLVDDLFSLAEDSPQTSFAVLDNDSLPAGETGSLVISAVGTPSAGGAVSISGDALLYTPAADFSGTETISYTAQAPLGGTATATVTVTVTPTADAPALTDDAFSLAEDSPQTSFAVLDNDSLPAGETGSLVISAVGTPSAGGTVSNTGSALLYTPAADFSGTETISYTVTAPHGGTATATATITVTPEPDAPILADDTFVFAEDSSQSTLSVLDNDALPAGESGTLVISAVGSPSAGGTVSNTGTALLYTPAADFNGTETISYTAQTPLGGTATATATITVTPEPDAPILADDTFVFAEDSGQSTLSVLDNDALPVGESGTLVISAVGSPSAGGTVSNTGTALLYTPAADFSGTETISYTVTAPDGGTATATATITVTPEPDAPILADDTFVFAEDSGQSTLSVLDNDALPAGESGTLVISAVGSPSAGGTVSNTGTALLYTPAADFNGTETISYTAQTPLGGTATATATITVTPEPDAPILADDTFVFAEDSGQSTLSVLDNDALPAGESGTLVISAVGSPSAGGTVSNTGTALLYTPAADFNGTETISYTAQTPLGGTATATATITVTPEPDAPILADDTFVFAEDSGQSTLSVLDNDALPAGESGTLVISAVGSPSAGGTVSNTGTALLYTPAADFSGTETISYTVTAPDGGTATATATIEIFSYTATIAEENPSGETGGGLDQIGGTNFVFAEIDSGGGDFSAIYATAAIENVAALLPGFEAEVIAGTSGQIWDLDFSSAFSGEVQITLSYDPSVVDIANFALAHVHDGATQILTAMPAGSSGPALLNQYIVDATLGQIQVALDQFSGLVLFNQQDPPDPSNPSTLSGRVFLDHNNNGVLDTDQQETPLGGVEIRLEAADGTTQTTFTAADGSYRFEGLAPGDYTITEDPDGKLQQVFADGAESAGSQGGNADSSADQISITELAADTSGVDNQHTEGSLQLGFVSRRDFLASTLPTHANAVVEPGAERALAYTLGSGWEDVESALIRLTEDRTEIELQITDTSGTEVATLDAEDPAQVRFRGQTSGIYLVGIIGSREDYAFAPVTAAATAGSGLAGAADSALQQLATEDPLPDGASSESAGGELGGLSAGAGEADAEAVDTVFGEPVLDGGTESTL